MKPDRRCFLKKTAIGTIGTITLPIIVQSYLSGNTAPGNLFLQLFIISSRRFLLKIL
jgi:hypothetical protein